MSYINYSPWQDTGNVMGNVGNSMAQVIMSQAINKQRQQQFMQQMALQQAQLEMDRQRQAAELPEIQARTGLINTQSRVAQQGVDRQQSMDDLARQVGLQIFRQKMGGNTPELLLEGQGANLEAGPGPRAAGAQVMDQASLMQNITQLLGMNNPANIETLMHGVNIPRNAVNLNPLTGQETAGPSAMTPYESGRLDIEQQRANDYGAAERQRATYQALLSAIAQQNANTRSRAVDAQTAAKKFFMGGSSDTSTNLAAVPPPEQRQVGQVVKTAKGTFQWDGQGWQPVEQSDEDMTP